MHKCSYLKTRNSFAHSHLYSIFPSYLICQSRLNSEDRYNSLCKCFQNLTLVRNIILIRKYTEEHTFLSETISQNMLDNEKTTQQLF